MGGKAGDKVPPEQGSRVRRTRNSDTNRTDKEEKGKAGRSVKDMSVPKRKHFVELKHV